MEPQHHCSVARQRRRNSDKKKKKNNNECKLAPVLSTVNILAFIHDISFSYCCHDYHHCRLSNVIVFITIIIIIIIIVIILIAAIRSSLCESDYRKHRVLQRR
jgi:hypothetical protein